MGQAARDENSIPTLIGVSNADGTTPVTVYVDPTTHRLLVSTSGSSTPGGADTQVQFNDGGVLSGDSGFTFNKTTNIATIGGAILSTAGNPLQATNSTDGASVQVAILQGDRATMADNDEGYISMKLSNDGALTSAAQVEFARLTFKATDVSEGSEDARVVIGVQIAGTLTSKLFLEGSVFSPAASDGTALGSATLMWADLFLASGAVINFNNGDLTLTHSAGVLTLGGSGAVTLALGTNSITMTGSIGATGARATKGWFTDVESTNMVTVGGNSLSTIFAAIADAFTDEKAQDAVGTILDNGTVGDVNFTYDDTTPKISGVVKAGAITYAKMQDVSATDKVLGRATAGSGDVEEIACTAFARSILDDADEATFKATVNLEIGTDVQAYNATLAAVAGGTYSGDDSIVTVGTLSAGNATAIVDAATTSAAGKAELATAAETTTGTDTGRVITPDGLAGSDYGKRVIGIQVVDAATNMATGDGKAFFRIPSVMNGWNLVGVAACVYTAGTTGTCDVQIRNVTDSQDMLSTKITIDSGETDTSTAATAAVINTSYDDVATGDKIAIDVDAIHTTAAKGLYVELIFQLP